ncbi:hypothetical protein L249_8252 [Ophiocordyceps polyrhachis-furcata BCC 54312]|uniref:Elongator complex protein 6 n=1 Tax=Ophiocordyceps polyrhachis-furcata BCC 54312 TaxID=1330021 RepID=A0A367LI35_9HYPO|nr:hypothetical protein L249_8252 [Ophiocordyceps polyrhachis-furcata BCC 54312]
MSKAASKSIPPLLQPLLSPNSFDQNSLFVLTSVLGATTNWLVLRYLYALLSPSSTHGGDDHGQERGESSASVVLVSFMRDGAFWREGASKISLDLISLHQRRRFAFVDGLSGLFVSPPQTASPDRILTSPDLSYVMANIAQALDRDVDAGPASAPRKVLIIDQIDVLQATTGLTSEAVRSALLSLRERVDATILTLAADDPLIHTQTTSLEREHASLVLSHAHAARTVVALRRLDSGPAPDVSGVMRISSRRRHPFDGENDAPLPPDAEYLYRVVADGSVTVFERGSR